MKLKLTPKKLGIVGHSFFVTIPRQWVYAKNLTKGDLLEMEIDDEGNLVLIGKKEDENKTKEIKC